MNYWLVLHRTEIVSSWIMHATVFLIAFFAYRRTKKPVFILPTLGALLGFALLTAFIWGDFSFTAWGFLASAWLLVAEILAVILTGVGTIGLILYAWRGLGAEPSPRKSSNE